ncbi:MAG: hypothetical protein E7162_05690 [Firmicutes bacterium]|nr:hypothetical protein [Bacillota bacterium]
MKKILSLILCGILLLTITGCGNDKTTTDEEEDSNNKIEDNIQEENNNEEEINDSESGGDDANLKVEVEVPTDAKVISKFVNSDDHDTYFLLMDDNTFVGARNICAGHVPISGTYEITYKNTLVGVEPDTLTLTYNDIDPVTNKKAKDVFTVIRNSKHTMTNLMVDIDSSSMHICACTDYDFYIVE